MLFKTVLAHLDFKIETFLSYICLEDGVHCNIFFAICAFYSFFTRYSHTTVVFSLKTSTLLM